MISADERVKNPFESMDSFNRRFGITKKENELVRGGPGMKTRRRRCMVLSMPIHEQPIPPAFHPKPLTGSSRLEVRSSIS